MLNIKKYLLSPVKAQNISWCVYVDPEGIAVYLKLKSSQVFARTQAWELFEYGCNNFIVLTGWGIPVKR